MKKMTLDQRRSLAEFFTNSAVAWLTAGIVAPFFLKKDLFDFISAGFWGLIFAFLCLLIAQLVIKGVKK